tara:strand:+ start:7050 stop:8081 length:1032 start_codon:yes stop_codon:yes gene_type:complete
MQIVKKNKKTLIIAEVGPNHNGSVMQALKMIKKIANAGADVIKFQLASPKEVYSDDAFKANYQKKNDGGRSILEMSKKVQLDKKDHFKLKRACKKAGVKYACSAFDINSIKFLNEKIGLPFFKIPSGEILSTDLLEYISKFKKPVLMSTGMSTFKEISYALNCLKKKNPKRQIILMHCVSSYPALQKNLNLNVMDSLKKKFKKEIGYSDHSIDNKACLTAVAKGAFVIEKHVTISRKKKGPDHKFSIEISTFRKLVKEIREVEKILGSKDKILLKDEINVRKVARKSLVTTKDLNKGHKLKRKDIVFKRPGIGISPINLKKFLGKKLLKNKKKNRVIFNRELS